MGLTKELVIGRVYAIGHRRKGDFRAQLIDVVEGDEADPQLLTVKIDTRPGSGQERLARSPRAFVTVTNLRPSLIVRMEELPDDEWLLSQRVIEERRRQADLAREAQAITIGQRRIERILSMIGRIGGKHG